MLDFSISAVSNSDSLVHTLLLLFRPRQALQTSEAMEYPATFPSPKQCCSRESTSPPSSEESVRVHLLLLLCKLLLHVGAVLGGGRAHSQERGLAHVGHSSCWHGPQGHATLQQTQTQLQVTSFPEKKRIIRALSPRRKRQSAVLMESGGGSAGGAALSRWHSSSPQGLALLTIGGNGQNPSNPACPKSRKAQPSYTAWGFWFLF